jgi:hypothetical protein
VTMPVTGTWYNGPAVTLPAGTWLVSASVTFIRTATTSTTWTARIFDGSTVHASGSSYTASVTNVATQIGMTAVVTLSSSTTVTVQGTTSAGANACLMRATTLTGSAPDATQVTAVRIA